MEGNYHGIRGVGATWADLDESWAQHRIEPEEFIASDDDQALAKRTI